MGGQFDEKSMKFKENLSKTYGFDLKNLKSLKSLQSLKGIQPGRRVAGWSGGRCCSAASRVLFNVVLACMVLWVLFCTYWARGSLIPLYTTLVNAVDCCKVWSEHCPYSIMYGPYRWFMAIFHTSMLAPSWTIHLKTHLKHLGNDTITLNYLFLLVSLLAVS